MSIRAICRIDGIQGFYRLFRIVWVRGTVGDGNGYSAKLSVALDSKILGWNKDADTDWCITFLGIRLHYCRSYGGIFAR